MYRNQKEGQFIVAAIKTEGYVRVVKNALGGRYILTVLKPGDWSVQMMKSCIPDLIMIEYGGKGCIGEDFIRMVKRDYIWMDIPMIIIGKDNTLEEEAFLLGAEDYIGFPAKGAVIRLRAGRLVASAVYRTNLEKLAEDKNTQLLKTQDAIIDMLSVITASRNNETENHLNRVSFYVSAIIDNLMERRDPKYLVGGDFRHNVAKVAKLHDIGQISVPDYILFKSGRLTAAEYNMVKKHTITGGAILNAIIGCLEEEASFLNVARQLIVSHHERWDGGGYPYGLEGREIPLAGRVMAIADTYDALITNKPYRNAVSHEQAAACIIKGAGTQFDPHLVKLSTGVFSKMQQAAETMAG